MDLARRRSGFSETAQHLHAGVGLIDRHPAVEPGAAERRRNRAGGGHRAGASGADGVARKPWLMKSASASLEEQRRVLAADLHRGLEGLDQRRRYDEVADAERWEHRLGQRADIDHAPGVVRGPAWPGSGGRG